MIALHQAEGASECLLDLLVSVHNSEQMLDLPTVFAAVGPAKYSLLGFNRQAFWLLDAVSENALYPFA